MSKNLIDSVINWVRTSYDEKHISDEGNDIFAAINNRNIQKQDLIKALSELLFNDISDLKTKVNTVLFMREILFLNEKNYVEYPEFFWLVINSQILFESLDISQVNYIADLLVRIGGTDNVRAYLSVILLTRNVKNWTNAVMAFYSVGHTVESLREANNVIEEFNGQNVQLSIWVYSDAFNMIKALVKSSDKISVNDTDYLLDFFKKGINFPNSHIQNIARTALELLQPVA